MVIQPAKRSSSEAYCTTASTITPSSILNQSAQPPPSSSTTSTGHPYTFSSSNSIERRFQLIKGKLERSDARMDSIENLCHQLKVSLDSISSQLTQLIEDVHTPNLGQVPKAPKLS